MIDLFERPALGLEPDKGISKARQRRPGPEVEETRKDRCDCDIGLDDVRRANDQREPDRTDDLADADPIPLVRNVEGQTSAAYGPMIAEPPSKKKSAAMINSQNTETVPIKLSCNSPAATTITAAPNP